MENCSVLLFHFVDMCAVGGGVYTCLCARMCEGVHTQMCKPEICTRHPLQLLLCFQTGTLSKPEAHQLMMAGQRSPRAIWSSPPLCVPLGWFLAWVLGI